MQDGLGRCHEVRGRQVIFQRAPAADKKTPVVVEVGLKPSPQQTLGRNVDRSRMGMEMIQETLALTADPDRRHVQRIERGTANPGIAVLARLKKALACTWEDLMGK